MFRSRLSRSLATESRLSKLLLLKGYNSLAPQLRQFSQKVVSLPDLFRTEKIPNGPAKSFAAVVSPALPRPKTPKIGTVKVGDHLEDASLDIAFRTPPLDIVFQALNMTKSQHRPIKKLNLGKIQRADGKKPVTRNRSDSSSGSSNDLTAEQPIGRTRRPTNGESIEVYQWEPVSAVKEGEWTESKPKSRRFGSKIGEAGGKASIVRSLKPRPCHMCVSSDAGLRCRYYLSPVGCKSGDECGYSHSYSES